MDDDNQIVLPPFEVTPAAVEKIVDLGGAVRIEVEDGGCCGTAYSYDRAESEVPRDGESRFGCPGAWLIVGRRAAEVLRGATLDYSDRIKPPRFRVLHNPNTAEICACRRSFGHPWPGPGQPTCHSYKPMPWDSSYQPPSRWKRQVGFDPS